jgi:transcriptional regulator with XRE-family HTH domain
MNIGFNKVLARVMQERNLNQLRLAAMLGIRQSQISNWLNGKSLPGYFSIKMLCEKLNVSADSLLEL